MTTIKHISQLKKLFRYGDASYLGSTLKECSFYHRDWKRDLDPAHVHKNFDEFKKYYAGDVFIEFVYLYKDGQWLVSDNYQKKELEFVPVKEHKDYSGEHKGMTEVDMISQIGKALSGAGFKQEDISMQSWESKRTKLKRFVCLGRVAAIKSLYDFKRTDAVWIPLLPVHRRPGAR